MNRDEAFYAAIILIVFAVIAIVFFYTCPTLSWIVYVTACEAAKNV